MSATWLDWFAWTRCELQRHTYRREAKKLPPELKTPEGVMRSLTYQCAIKAIEFRRKGARLRETERFLSILTPYFLPPQLLEDLGNTPPKNMRVERDTVDLLLRLKLTGSETDEWLENCMEHPVVYIDLPMNAWMISDEVQVSAIFVDNGVGEPNDVAFYVDDEPRPIVSAFLAPRGKRSKRRLVWPLGTDDWHNELMGGTIDDMAGETPPTAEMIAGSHPTPQDFCRRVEGLLAATLFQEHSLRAAEVSPRYVAPLPSDALRRAVAIRDDREDTVVRSLFRIERIGAVPEEARSRLPRESEGKRRGPLLCPVWVRSHWRNQRYGPGLSQIRRTLIQRHRKGPESGLPKHPMARIERVQHQPLPQ